MDHSLSLGLSAASTIALTSSSLRRASGVMRPLPSLDTQLNPTCFGRNQRIPIAAPTLAYWISFLKTSFLSCLVHSHMAAC
ncbi:MAG: hypothetical protein QXH62_06225 [Candidatus Bathyarchaeia archaeon]